MKIILVIDVLVVIDNFSKFGSTVPLKKKNAQAITNSFENILINSKRKSNLIESDDGKEFVNKNFTDFLNKNNIKRYSRYASLGAVFAECFNRTIRGRSIRKKWFSKTEMEIGLILYPQ